MRDGELRDSTGIARALHFVCVAELARAWGRRVALTVSAVVGVDEARTCQDARSMPRMTIADLEALMDRHFPDWRNFSTIEALTDRELTLRMPFKTQLLRAGGTISGPALMALADTAAYFLTLALAGPVPQAATANLDIHFLARPKPGDVVAVARMLRLGRRLAVSTVELRSDGSEDVVAHATVTYALPSQ